MVVNYAQFKSSLAALAGTVVYYTVKQPGFVAIAGLANGDTLVHQADAPPPSWGLDFPAAVQVDSLQF